MGDLGWLDRILARELAEGLLCFQGLERHLERALRMRRRRVFAMILHMRFRRVAALYVACGLVCGTIGMLKN